MASAAEQGEVFEVGCSAGGPADDVVGFAAGWWCAAADAAAVAGGEGLALGVGGVAGEAVQA